MFNFYITSDNTKIKIILESLNTLNKKYDTLMSKITDLTEKIAELQSAVDQEQEQIKVLVDGQTLTVSNLEATIARLQELVDAGLTDEEVKAILAELNVIKEDVKSTVADAVALPPAPVEPTPVEPLPSNELPIEFPVVDVPIEETPPVFVEPAAPISAVDPNAPAAEEVV